MSKILIAYFSHSGTTRRAAETVQKAVGGKLYEIEPKNAYPASYNEVLAIAKKEKESEARPALKNDPGAEIKAADVVFLGYPLWWYDAPMIIYSFLESASFKGKRLIPFATSGGSGLSGSDEKIASIAKTKPEKAYLARFKTDDKELAAWAAEAIGK